MILPADEDAALPLDPSEEALDGASVACSGLAGADLAWAACCGCSECGAIISMPSRRNSSSSGSLS